MRNLVTICLGAAFTPFVILSIYLTLSRWPHRIFTATSDCFALMMSILAGGVFLARLPLKMWLRILFIAVYVIVGGYGLTLYSLYFVGIVFRDWL